MSHIVDPRQNRFFDPFDGVFPRSVAGPSPTVGRASFATSSSTSCPSPSSASTSADSIAAPTKELYSMAGLVFLADFLDWTAQTPSRRTCSAPTSSSP